MRGLSSRKFSRSAPDSLQRPEPGSAAHAAGIAVLCGYERSVSFLAEDVLLQACGNVFVDAGNLRSATAHHKDVGVQQIDDASKTASVAVFEALQRGEICVLARFTARLYFQAVTTTDICTLSLLSART